MFEIHALSRFDYVVPIYFEDAYRPFNDIADLFLWLVDFFNKNERFPELQIFFRANDDNADDVSAFIRELIPKTARNQFLGKAALDQLRFDLGDMSESVAADMMYLRFTLTAENL